VFDIEGLRVQQRELLQRLGLRCGHANETAIIADGPDLVHALHIEHLLLERLAVELWLAHLCACEERLGAAIKRQSTDMLK